MYELFQTPEDKERLVNSNRRCKASKISGSEKAGQYVTDYFLKECFSKISIIELTEMDRLFSQTNQIDA